MFTEKFYDRVQFLLFLLITLLVVSSFTLRKPVYGGASMFEVATEEEISEEKDEILFTHEPILINMTESVFGVYVSETEIEMEDVEEVETEYIKEVIVEEESPSAEIETLNDIQQNPVVEPILSVDEQELWALAHCIYAESEIDGEEGMLATAEVVMNRVRHHWYPDTVYGVVYHVYNGTYQFCVV